MSVITLNNVSKSYRTYARPWDRLKEAMTQRPTLIFDFDSTLVGFETLEALADVALDGAPDAVAVRSEIAALTDRAMAGEIPFGEALRRRLALLPLRREHVEAVAARAVDALTPSVRRNLRFFAEAKGRVAALRPRRMSCPVRPHRSSRTPRCLSAAR